MDDREEQGHSSFRYISLDRVLERPQITGIAFSGTVGIGLFVTSGEFIAISGSLGCVLGFLIAGLIVIGVMRSLAEMVSVRPVQGALIDYPKTFVNEALGFAVGVTYWIAQCMSMVVLTAAAARSANYFHPEQRFDRGQVAGVVAALVFITLISNLCGVKLYGNLERVVEQIKFATIITLCVLMIIVNLGVGGYSTIDRDANYTRHSFPPGLKFDGYNSTNVTESQIESSGISGHVGQFLGVWTAITLAMFACQGGDLVIVSAGEARVPRKDLPAVARFMYLAPLACYILGSFLVGFNINYSEPDLFHPWKKPVSRTTPSPSPFIIVFEHCSLAPKVLPNIFNALFLFSAYTAANTALYASSRTLFTLAQDYGNEFLRRTIGTTGKGCTPHRAILVSSVFGLMAFLGLVDEDFNQPILSLSAFFTSAVACVYASQCIAFLRFLKGLRYLDEQRTFSRDEDNYTTSFGYYRAHWQPFCAMFGLLGCCLIILFSGWPAIYLLSEKESLSIGEDLKSNSDLAWDLICAYLGPAMFLLLYFTHKIVYPYNRLREFKGPDVLYLYRPQLNLDEKLPGSDEQPTGWRGWAQEVWSFIK